jgi:hypothetical protein
LAVTRTRDLGIHAGVGELGERLGMHLISHFENG